MVLKFAAAAAAIAVAFALIRLGSMKTTSRIEADKALLAAAPVQPGSTVVREYLRTEGNVVWRGRQYATDLALPEAATTVTQFYNDKLTAAGWQVIDHQAALSTYSRGSDRLALGSIGADLPEASRDKRVIQDVRPPSSARYYYGVEVSSGAATEAPK